MAFAGPTERQNAPGAVKHALGGEAVWQRQENDRVGLIVFSRRARRSGVPSVDPGDCQKLGTLE